MVMDMRALLEQERKRRLQQTTAAPAVHKDVPLLQKAALEQARCDLDAASVGAEAIQVRRYFISLEKLILSS